jgi:soluble lytic murein transglycosylase-like protein
LTIETDMKRIGAALLCALVFTCVSAGPTYADIYVRRGPDGTLHFSNCPMGTQWKLYARETPRRYPQYQYRRNISAKTPVQFETMINSIANDQGMNPTVIKSIIAVESGYDPNARSSKGAMGLMQLMPETAQDLGVADPWDPMENITAGTKFFSYLLRKYNGNLTKALAAYNAGPAVVDAYNGIPPYQETEDYVRNVLARIYGGGYARE